MTAEHQLERETELLNRLAEQRTAEIRAQVPPDRMGPELCDECDGAIHIDRRMIGYRTCIECARYLENTNNRYGRR